MGMKLGVFDSGIGGEAIATALQENFQDAEIIVVNDRDNVPYGDKSAARIIELTEVALQPLLKASCDVIVIACNSATTAAISYLRATYPEQKFIGIEPMIKPAAAITKTKVIAVCATPATLRSERYQSLVRQYGNSLTIIEPDCSRWAQMIEDNAMNEAEIRAAIEPCLKHAADVIVLGCTHYHWIKDEIIELADGKAVVLEPSEAITDRIRTLLRAD